MRKADKGSNHRLNAVGDLDALAAEIESYSSVTIDDVTCDGAYTVGEVVQDKTLVSPWLVDGTWFYSTLYNALYKGAQTSPYTISLDLGNQIYPENRTDEESLAPSTYDITSVCELLGEIEGGYLHGLHRFLLPHLDVSNGNSRGLLHMDERSHMPTKVRDELSDAKNVTGGEFAAPFDLDGYLSEPQANFGLWVGETEDEAELLAFEINGEQIQQFAEVFTKMVEDADELESSQ